MQCLLRLGFSLWCIFGGLTLWLWGPALFGKMALHSTTQALLAFLGGVGGAVGILPMGSRGAAMFLSIVRGLGALAPGLAALTVAFVPA
jgi:hypothetical protein